MNSKKQNRPSYRGWAVGKRTRSSFASNIDYSSYQNRTPVHVSGKPVAYVEGQTLFKRIRGKKHMLHTPPAIAFDTDSLHEAQLLGARLVQVTDTETGTVYKTTIDQIWSEGFGLNRGHGQQQALCLSKWNSGQEQDSQQLSLFEVDR